MKVKGRLGGWAWWKKAGVVAGLVLAAAYTSGALSSRARCAGWFLNAQTERLDLKGCGLTTLPPHIDWCALKALTFIDLSQNRLQHVPDTISCAQSVRTLFISENPALSEIPGCVRQLKQLRMYAQKSCGLASFDASQLPPSLVWLILTDNKLTSLPDLSALRIRKLMLSHNRLASQNISAFPTGIEMISMANNQLTALPDSLAAEPSPLKNLSWVVLASNPLFPDPDETQISVPDISLDSLPRLQVLATNQDKAVVRSALNGRRTAIKFFGAIDSSGLPGHEVMVNGVIGGGHAQLMNCFAVQLENRARRPAVALEYLDRADGWASLGSRPTMQTVTRGTWKAVSEHHPLFSDTELLHVAILVARAVAALHSLGIVHGDVYAHNIMARAHRGLTQRAEIKLGDFGTSTLFKFKDTPGKKSSTDSESVKVGLRLRHWELRAFGLFLDGILSHSQTPGAGGNEEGISRGLVRLKRVALEAPLGDSRASFGWFEEELQSLAAGWTGIEGAWQRSPGESIRDVTLQGLYLCVRGNQTHSSEHSSEPCAVAGFADDRAAGVFRVESRSAHGKDRVTFELANYSQATDAIYWENGDVWSRP